MKQPKQLPAVDRKSTKCTSPPAGTKVGPNWDLSAINTGFLPINPAILSAMSRP
jgi:hypothetical protein